MGDLATIEASSSSSFLIRCFCGFTVFHGSPGTSSSSGEFCIMSSLTVVALLTSSPFWLAFTRHPEEDKWCCCPVLNLAVALVLASPKGLGVKMAARLLLLLLQRREACCWHECPPCQEHSGGVEDIITALPPPPPSTPRPPLTASSHLFPL